MAIVAMLLAFFFVPQEGFMAKQMKGNEVQVSVNLEK